MSRHPFWARAPIALWLCAQLVVLPQARAAATDLADIPLINAATTSVLPNIMFVLDNSGSMDWNYMPDYVARGSSNKYCLTSQETEKTEQVCVRWDSRGRCKEYDDVTSIVKEILTATCVDAQAPMYAGAFNRVYYNPTFTYAPPTNADRTSKKSYSSSTDWTAVPEDGYGIQSTSSTNLLTRYPEKVYCKSTSSDVNSADCQPSINSSGQYAYPDQTYFYPKTRYGAPFYYTVTVQWCPNPTSTLIEFGTATGCTDYRSKTNRYVRYSNWQRVNITSASTNMVRAYADEMTNFANWYAWYRTRMQLMKTGVGLAFKDVYGTTSSGNASLNARVGFARINSFGSSSPTVTNSGFLPVLPFDEEPRKNWYANLYASNPSGSTPLRPALANAGRYYAGELKMGTNPEPIEYACQQNYTMLSTDGYWNAESVTPLSLGGTAVGDQDGDSRSVTKPYLDALKKSNTLADVAMYYYMTDLKPGTCPLCANEVSLPPKSTIPWMKDEANHQHMNTFTIGLGVDGTLRYTSAYETQTSGDFNDLVQGTKQWPDPMDTEDEERIDDLWHAAVNGRGQYLSARDPESLINGLLKALGSIKQKDGAGAAAATSNLQPVEGDNFIYVANYTTVTWDGRLNAYSIDLSTGQLSTDPVWEAGKLLGDQITSSGTADTRTIYYGTSTGLKDFTWANLSSTGYLDPTKLTQYTSFSTAEKALAKGENLLKYLRGQSQYEMRGKADDTNLFRERRTVLGDIVHSQPIYVQEPPYTFVDNGYAAYKSAQATRAGTVYVGANDGMLHAFDSVTGRERWAYIPPMVLPNLYRLADQGYAGNHRFFVDGALAVSDVYDETSSSWKTILVGGLGKGGRGYYALDITNPTSPKQLWTFTADDDANLGYSYGMAVITKVGGAWRVIVPTGYNNIPETVGGSSRYTSANGRGGVFVLDAITGNKVRRIDTSAGDTTTPSGLARISAWVEQFEVDNATQWVYGGDLNGNLWRVDVLNGVASKVISLGDRKPITAAPEMGRADGKQVIYFGTGRYLGQTDLSNRDVQTIYAVRDDGVSEMLPANLVTQTLSGTGSTSTISANAVDWSTAAGWQLHLPGNGERVHLEAQLYFGSVLVPATIPEATVCKAGGTGRVYALDYASGSAVLGQQAVFVYASPVAGVAVAKLPGTPKFYAIQMDGTLPQPETMPINTGSGGASAVRRVMWRELLD